MNLFILVILNVLKVRLYLKKVFELLLKRIDLAISVLPNISKVYYGIINECLTSYFMSNGLLAESQFGFRENKNKTELAKLHLIDKILPAFEIRSYNYVFVYFSISVHVSIQFLEIFFIASYLNTAFRCCSLSFLISCIQTDVNS